MFPDLERPPDQRTAVERETIPWTNAADAVLIAAVCLCPSSTAFSLCAEPLLRLVGHLPVYADTAYPPLRKRVDDCIRAIELRIVTKMLGARNWEPTGHVGFLVQFWTPESPLTWGEKVKILRPYHRKIRDKKEKLTQKQVCQILGRDEETVDKYLRMLNGPEFIDKEQDGPPPVRGENFTDLKNAFRDLGLAGKDRHVSTQAFRQLWILMGAKHYQEIPRNACDEKVDCD